MTLCRYSNSINMEHNKEQNQCSYDFHDLHYERTTSGLNGHVKIYSNKPGNEINKKMELLKTAPRVY